MTRLRKPRKDKVRRSVVLVSGSQRLSSWKTSLRLDKFFEKSENYNSTSIMFWALNTPEKDVKRQAGAQETREPAGSLSLSRSGLTHVADWVLKNSALKVSLGVLTKRNSF